MANLESGWLDFWRQEKLSGQLLLPAAQQIWLAARERTVEMLPSVVACYREMPFAISDWVYPQSGMHLMARRKWFGLYSQAYAGNGEYDSFEFTSAFYGILGNFDISTGGGGYGMVSGYYTYNSTNNTWNKIRNWRSLDPNPPPEGTFDIARFLIHAYRVLNALKHLAVDSSGTQVYTPPFRFHG